MYNNLTYELECIGFQRQTNLFGFNASLSITLLRSCLMHHLGKELHVRALKG